jgi:hypothetical protein
LFIGLLSLYVQQYPDDLFVWYDIGGTSLIQLTHVHFLRALEDRDVSSHEAEDLVHPSDSASSSKQSNDYVSCPFCHKV